MNTVNILGTIYNVEYTTDKADKCLVDKSGYCDYTNKRISIETQYDDVEVEDMEVVIRQTIRHEIVHAFLFESGLHLESWGTNEEIVDWIALQFPKMLEAFQEVGQFTDLFDCSEVEEKEQKIESLRNTIKCNEEQMDNMRMVVEAHKQKEESLQAQNNSLREALESRTKEADSLAQDILKITSERDKYREKCCEYKAKKEGTGRRRGRPPKDRVHEAAVDILNTD